MKRVGRHPSQPVILNPDAVRGGAGVSFDRKALTGVRKNGVEGAISDILTRTRVWVRACMFGHVWFIHNAMAGKAIFWHFFLKIAAATLTFPK
jgi:hypothetical protein